MHTIREICDMFTSLLGNDIRARGRITSVRRMKKSVFVDLTLKASKIQCCFEHDSGYRPENGDLVEVFGKCFYTNTKEPTIDVFEVSVVNNWKADVEYGDVLRSKVNLLQAFSPEAYQRFHYPQAVRNFIRQFLTSRSYFEVQTPILGRNYNGGKSFPVTSSYLGKSIGFNRTTMEDRMQAIIGIGYKRIFQIGSIFRSDKEHTFLEGYEAFLSWEDGKELIKEMLAYVVEKLVQEGIGDVDHTAEDIMNKHWLEIDFFAGAFDKFKMDSELISRAGDEMVGLLAEKGVLKSNVVSLESIADELANAIASGTGMPTIVNGFPVWSSPLYAPCGVAEFSVQIQRSRMYLPGLKGGFEIGVQENDYDRFLDRLNGQREVWKLSNEDIRIADSDLAKVISGGLPPIFGFGMNPDRILRIWRKDCAIDPYNE